MDSNEKMRLSKKIVAYVLTASFVLGSNTSAAAVNPSVTKKITINVGSKKTIKVKGSFITSKSFKSANKKIATVNKKGVVTAKSVGKCKIKITVKYRKSKKTKKVYEKKLSTTVIVKKANKPTATPESTQMPEPTIGPEMTMTPEETKAPMVTVSPENTKMPLSTPKATQTPKPTASPKVTQTPKPTASPKVTQTPKPTASPKATQTPKPTASPTATVTPTAKPTPTSASTGNTPSIPSTPTITVSPEVTPTAVPTPTKTPAAEVDEVVNIELSAKELVLYEGETFVLNAVVTPVNAKNEKLVWKSEDESVVVVDDNGKITAKSAGFTTVTVQCGTKKAECTVEVVTNTNGLDIKATDIKIKIAANGEYSNWDGVSNVSQFIDNSGRYCFAYDNEDSVFVVKTENGLVVGDSVRLEKVHSIFGGVTCDNAGNYYLVTGETNTGSDTNQETVFISKYDANGNLIKTVGDNGSSSLAYYYDSSFYTKEPFHGGNCDVAINGNILTVHYAREMYSGHQSNSVFTINTETMEKVSIGDIYQSHCFAQRVVPYQNGFVYAGEGDCFNRAFTVNIANGVNGKNTERDIFHFWVKEGTYDNWDMSTLNNNFAHIGGLASVDGTNIALAGTSVKALSAEAESQSEQLFIQIFNPAGDLSYEASYITSGTRSGLGGKNGNEAVTDYGVKWLSDFDADTTISHPQIVSDGNGTIIILFEKYVNRKYKGVYYMELSANGTIQKDISCLSENACLNPCRMPIYSDGKIYWTANKYNDKNNAYIYSFSVM